MRERGSPPTLPVKVMRKALKQARLSAPPWARTARSTMSRGSSARSGTAGVSRRSGARTRRMAKPPPAPRPALRAGELLVVDAVVEAQLDDLQIAPLLAAAVADAPQRLHRAGQEQGAPGTLQV